MPEAALNGAGSHAAAAPAERRRTVAVALAIAAVAMAVYLPALFHDFVNWDDDLFVTANEAVTSPAGLARIWSTVELPAGFPNYPLVFTSFWIEHRLWDLHPSGYHATNILLHGINVLLVWWLIRALGAGQWTAGFTAALFGLHPMQVESVAWLAERKNVLSGVFYLTAFVAYLRHRARGEWRWYAISLLALACALLSKTATVVLPASLLIADRLRAGRWSRASVARIAPMVALCLAVAGLTLAIEHRPATVPLAARPLLAATALWFYVGKLLVPLPLLPIYAQWEVHVGEARWWLPLIGAVVAAVCGYRWISEWRVRWGLAHFVCTLMPVLGLRAYGFSEHSFVADRNVYLAAIGMFLSLAIGLDRLRRVTEARPVNLLAGLLLTTCGALTWLQIPVWRDSVTLWSHAVAGNPRAWAAQNNLGLALIGRGRLDDAARHLDAALALWPDYPEAHNNLALVRYRQQRFDAAVEHARRAAALDPTAAGYHKNYGLALQAQGASAAAEAEFRRAADLEPSAPYYYLLAEALVSQGQLHNAIAEFEHAVALDPGMLEARNQLGRTLLAVNRPADAAGAFTEIIRRRPDWAEARYNLSLALRQLGRVDEAVRQLETVLAVRPDFTAARDALAAMRAERVPEAHRDSPERAADEPEHAERQDRR